MTAKNSISTGYPTRTTKRRNSETRKRLLDAAEILFGKYGINAVSLREITIQAGQSNNSTVQYHFGDKNGLIQALLNDRIERIEKKRARILAERTAQTGMSETEALDMLWRPLVEMSSRDGYHYLIRFLLDYQVLTGGRRHPLVVSPASHQASIALTSQLRRHYDHMSSEQFSHRLSTAAIMFWSMISANDHERLNGVEKYTASELLQEAIVLAIAILSAPQVEG